MKSICGLDIDRDRMSLSFAAVKKDRPVFVEERLLLKGIGDQDLLRFLGDNAGQVRKTIEDFEARRSSRVARLYLKLPAGMERMNTAEEVVALKRTKKINFQDISFIKKYLEDNALDWDDCCIHHFPLDFGVEGRSFEALPVGFWTKRIRVRSLLVTVKDKVRTQVGDILNNYNIAFGGLVSSGVSDFSAVFSDADKKNVKAVVSVGYDGSFLTVVDKGVVSFVDSFCFGAKYVIEHIARNFSIPFDLSREIFDRYLSFEEARGAGESACAADKEISIKDAGIYINISLSSLNAAVREYVRENLLQILGRLEAVDGRAVTVAFLGRLNGKDGFAGLLKDFVKYDTVLPEVNQHSSSFGCLRYGMMRFLEKRHMARLPLTQRLSKLYKDYF